MKAWFVVPVFRSGSRSGRLLAHLGSALLVVPLMVAVTFAALTVTTTATASADASPGSGGTLVPLEGRLVSTLSGLGLPKAKLTASTWTAVQAGGVTPAGQSSAAQTIPASATALAISVEAPSPSTSGYVQFAKDGDTAHPFSALNYDVGFSGSAANSAIVPLSTGGKFDVWASTSIDVYIDVQGYYTGGATGYGGYVPLAPTRIADTRGGTGIDGTAHKLSTNTAYVATVPTSVVPAGASAVFVNMTVLSTGASDAGYVTTYADGDTKPSTGLYYSPATNTALGATVPLNPTTGKFDLYVGGSTTPVDVVIDIEGYFAPTAPGGAFTPGAARVFDSGAAAVTPGQTIKIQIAGVKGVPVAGSGISAVAVAFQLDDSSGQSGYARLWAADQTEPATSNLNYSGTSGTRLIRSNMAIVALSGDGAINLHNITNTTGNVRYSMDVIGWYTGGSVIAYQQTRTQSAVTLKAVGTPNATAVTYQYRSGTSGSWTVLPADTTSSVLTKAGTSAAYTGGQPIADNGTAGSFDPYVWDVAKTVATNNPLLLQVQACYTVPNTTATPCDTPQNLQYAPTFGDSHATDSVGPGTLSLQTGDYQIAATDVSMAGYDGTLTVGRSLTTRSPANPNDTATDAASVFGPGWTASFPGPDSGDGEAYVDDHTADQGYVQIVQSDGSTDTFLLTSQNYTAPTSTAPITYAPVGDTTPNGDKLTKYNEGTGTGPAHFRLVDADGTVTIWNYNSAAAVKWNVASVQKPGTGTAATYIRDTAGLVTRILAATPAGITCTGGVDPTTTVGCRGLSFTYSTTTSGSTHSRLTDVTIFAPTVAGTANNTIVEHYDYSNGRLLDEYDPRLPNLKTTYAAFDSNGRLTGMTAAGQQPWTFSYDSNGRLSSASHPTFVAGSTTPTTATTTVVYGAPFTGVTGMPDIGATAAAAWGQTDLPYTATAVFDPTKIPTTTDPTAVTVATYRYADVTYIDPDGNPVNTAAYGIVAGVAGWRFGASAFDVNGNNVWSLTAANRAQALTASTVTDAWVKTLTTSAARAKWLRTDNVYDPVNPAEQTDSYGPVHQIKLASGAMAEVRDHTDNTYDSGDTTDQPALGVGDPAYQLVTSTVTSPQIVATDGTTSDGTGADVRETDYNYNRIDRTAGSLEGNGWTLRTPVTTTVVGFGAPSLSTVTRYNQAGQIIEKRLPAAAGTSTSADTTKTSYYTATGTAPCGGKPAVAGLVCQTSPGAAPTLLGTGNPGTAGPTGATTTTTYDSFDNPLVVTEAYPAYAGHLAVTRTSTTHYDTAERKDSDTTVTAQSDSTPVAGNTDLPTTTYIYDQNNGHLAATNWVDGSGTITASITTGFDADARPVTYTDASAASGGPGNTSTATYDIAGRVITSTDARGSYTYTYDGPTNEHRGLVTGVSIAATTAGNSTVTNTFGAAYDADSRTAVETYPNGLTATTGYDNDGNPTSLNYALGSTNWLSFAATIGADSRITAQTSSRAGVTQSSQNYSYDAAGRLAQVQDTVASTGVCSTRQYYFDVNSNRTNLVSADGAAGGACPTPAYSTPAAQQNFYDTADHLTNTGYSYDQLGRTLTVPGADTQGTGPNASTTGDVSLGYWGNDLVHTETQAGGTGKTLSYSLDPNATRISTITDSATNSVTTNHYDGDNDKPDWTSTAAAADPTTMTGWTRSLEGTDGDLAASIDQNGVVTLDLANLHGDVVATANNDVNATGTATYAETTEYGAPRDPANAETPYGWLGKKRRSDQDLAGLITMGVRLYNPATGRFLQVDPVEGGSANDYVYPADPVNDSDLTGQRHHHHHHHWWDKAWKYTKHHWRGMLQGAGFAACLALSAGACAAVGVGIAAVSAFHRRHGHTSFDWRGFAVDSAWAIAGGSAGRGLSGSWRENIFRYAGRHRNVYNSWLGRATGYSGRFIGAYSNAATGILSGGGAAGTHRWGGW